jgi:two-component sensor histidine kinase
LFRRAKTEIRLQPTVSTNADTRGRNPRRRRLKPWPRIGSIRSLRFALLAATALAVAPMMLFASGMAVLRAREADRLPDAAAWLTVSALPLLIGFAAILAVAMAWEGLVMRWLTYLQRLAHAYARGRYSLRPSRLKRAPAEFRALGEAVEEMAAAVEHRDHALRDALDEQTVLLREVHHRVKNNMQIVGSLLSLQAQADPQARDALRDALVRVDAIALGQRFMRDQEEEEHVAATELFDAFIRQSRARLGAGRRELQIVGNIEPGLLPLETGSRLVFLTAEALLHACHACPGPLVFRLGLRFEEGAVTIVLQPAVETAEVSAASRVCSDLFHGYVRQLHGRLEALPGGATQVRVPLARARPAAANDGERGRRAPDSNGHSNQDSKFFRILDRTERWVAS